jgi:hypothetical protein
MTERRDVPARALLLIALLPFARFALDCGAGLDRLIYQYLVDDAFYYFEISKHIPEFNRGIPNSGFHPLWAFVVAPLHRAFDAQVAISVSLALGVMGQAAGALALNRLLAQLGSPLVALAGAAAFAANGSLYNIAMMGVETVPATAVVISFFAYFASLLDDTNLSLRQAVVCGLLAGACFWARMDSPLLVGPAVLYLGWHQLTRGRSTAFALLNLSACFLPVLWILYIRVMTGAWFPTSGQAIRVLAGVSENSIVPKAHAIVALKQLAHHGSRFAVAHPSESASLTISGVGLAVVCWALFSRSDAMRSKNRRVCALIALGTLLWSSYYILFQGVVRDWYAAQTSALVFVVCVPFIMSLLQRRLSPQVATGGCALLVVLLAITSTTTRPNAPQEFDKYQSALAANRVLSGEILDGKIGSFNSGIYNYFMDADVINLDGVVNPEALRALKDNSLPEYMNKERITYLIEHDIGLAANFERVHSDSRFELERWISLSDLYQPHAHDYAKKTYLWKVRVLPRESPAR